ncbi:sugar ABC transporter substrate-binding protein [Microbacterium sp. M3]|uniref:Sugar ABC transporter substrate-binding protein n=1 Tax=Microbacterium arthrosphaerae TaxID=792652 RepID=A0ABU4GYC3_9MICO|nr:MULTISPECIES: sugar ABC transporter substrate-binding protein [Microbacterium]MDW4572078.1 sugar ABC transporter substrate-binding protein [Microbacterium arthrosphaerae]MDW7605933.1 sugar ABC transporter substrate-binding protein [Microbacterium sp. M3]
MRKSRKSVVAAAATLAVGGLLLSGCAGGSGGGGEEQLTFMFRGSDAEKAAYTAAIEQFEKDNDVDVKIIMTTADEYSTKLKAAITGKQVPDVFYIDPGSVQAYVKTGIIKDITEYVEGDEDLDLDNVWQYGVDSYRFDGELMGQGAIYAMPKDVGPFSFGYNRTMFEKAGIPLPSPDEPYTWDQFVDVAKQLTQDTNGDGTLDQWGTGLNVQWNLQPFVWSNGGDWLNEDRTEVTVDSPEFAEALQWFADLSTVEGVTPSTTDAQTLDTYQRWMQGQIGFFPVGPWDVPVYETLDFDWDLIPYPVGATGETATWTGTLGIAVSESTKDPDMAAKLAIYLSTDPTAQQSLVDAGVQIPNLIDMADEWVASSTLPPDNKQEFLDIVQDYGRALPANTTYSPEWYDELFKNIQPVLDGEQTAADYLKEVQPRMQEMLDKANADAGIG